MVALLVVGIVAVILQGLLLVAVVLLIRYFSALTESFLLLHQSILELFSESVRHRVNQNRNPHPAPFTSDESTAA